MTALKYRDPTTGNWVILPGGSGLPAGGTPNQVVGRVGSSGTAWLGPMWWRWTGTQAEYDALTSYDDRVLYVIVAG